MGSSKKYQPKDFESTIFYSDEFKNKRADTSANIYESMLLSHAWKELTSSQKALYLTCKSQYYSLKRKPVVSEDNEHGSEKCFYMNRFLWCERYGLYKKNNQHGFQRDMAALINKGFIICVWRGLSNKSKSVYKLSARWQKYGQNDFVEASEHEKTDFMTGKAKERWRIANNKKV